MQLESVNLWYVQLRLFDLTEFTVCNIETLPHRVAKMKEVRKLEYAAKTCKV